MPTQKAISDNVVRTEGRIAILREKDKHGNDTGHAFYRCDCGAELLTRYSKERLEHKPGCPLGGDGR